MKKFLPLLLALQLALGAMAWEMILANQTDLYQYFNLVRCLAANEATSNSKIGLDSDNILALDIIAQDTDHSNYVLNRCWETYANKTLLHYSMNDQDDSIIQPVHITETLNGHEMFKNCRRPQPIGARDIEYQNNNHHLSSNTIFSGMIYK